MNESAEQQSRPRAWQPLTFGGVARYAHDWIGRLIITLLFFAAVAASVIVFVCNRAWVPIIEAAIEKLPPGAEIRGGRLNAPGPVLLAESPFLSIRLNPENSGLAGSPADLQVELARNDVRFRSIFGGAAIPYQPQWTIGLSRTEREPWWGAWKPATFAWLWFGTVVYLMASWFGLALSYFIPARVAAFYADKDVTVFGAWKLCMAGLMPGAILLSIGLLLYGLAQIRLLELLGAFVLHFIVGLLFITGGILRLPPVEHKVQNPFEPEPEETEAPAPVEEPKKNPFA